MSILLLSCIREIRNGEGLLMRAGACIPDGRAWWFSPGSAAGYFNLSSASVYLTGQNCIFLAHLPPYACDAFGGCSPGQDQGM